MTTEQINSIGKHHKPSFGGLWRIFKHRKFMCEWPFLSALILSLLTPIIFIIFSCDKSFEAISGYIDLVLLVFPCLLGFSLAGYAIVVGFPNNELLAVDAEVEDYSMYQVLNAFFAIAILLQIITTGLAFIISGIIKLDMTSRLNLHCNILFAVTNITFLTILIFTSLFSIFLTPYIVINLFSLSQANSSHITIKKFNK